MYQFPIPRITIFFALGIAVADRLRQFEAMPFLFGGALVVLIALAIILRNKEHTASITLLTASICLGGFLMSIDWRIKKSVRLPENYVEYEAVVSSTPVNNKDCQYTCDLLTTSFKREYKLRATIMSDEPLKPGDLIHCISRWNLSRKYYPEQRFDYTLYLKRHGYAATTFVELAERPTAGPSSLRTSLLKLRTRLLDALVPDNRQTHQGQALVAAMILGDRTRLTEETRNDYSAAGASHILALSGLHLSILISILSLLLSQMGRKTRSFISIVFIWAFAFLVGMPVSLVRVAIMFSIMTLADMLGRDAFSIGNLFTAAFLILLFSPQSLYDVSFQLSFSAVFFILLIMGIITLYRKNSKQKNRKRRRWVQKITSLPIVSFAAQLGTLPLILYHFGQFPTYFLLTNLLVGLFAMLIISLGVLALCLSFITSLLSFSAALLSVFAALQSFVRRLLLFIADTMNDFVNLIAHLPYSTVTDIHFSAPQALLLYILIFLLLMPFYRINSRGYRLSL